MWALWVLVAMVSVTGFVALGNEVRHPPPSAVSASDLAWNMAVYRNAVLQYALAHPGFSGSAPDAALPFPAWYRRNPLWANRVEGGSVAVYATKQMPADLPAEMATLAKGSFFVGVADAKTGKLVSPTYGPTGLTLPPGIPDGVPVWLAVAA